MNVINFHILDNYTTSLVFFNFFFQTINIRKKPEEWKKMQEKSTQQAASNNEKYTYTYSLEKKEREKKKQEFQSLSWKKSKIK